MTRRPWPALFLFSLTFLILALASGCGSPGGDGGTPAVPSYCPTRYASAMPSPQAAGNTPPFAYFQDVTVYVGETADVTLFACDPDLGIDYVGLSWAITAQPAYGATIVPSSGVYDGQPFQAAYTPGPAFVGTDRFVYWVSDGEAWSNTAEVRVEVLDWPAGLLVGGPGSAVENTVLTFTAGVLLASGGTADVTAAAAWSEDSPYASFGAPGQLTVGEVPSDQLVTVTATYTLNGRSVADTLTVILQDFNGLLADSSTVALYKFDTDTGGTVVDSSINGNDGVAVGTTLVRSPFGKARLFDSIDDYVDYESAVLAMQGTTAFSVEYLARSPNGIEVPMFNNGQCGSGWWLQPNENEILYAIKTNEMAACYWNYDGTNQFSSPLPLGLDWHYYAMTWDGSEVRIYRDGALVNNPYAVGGALLITSTAYGATSWLGGASSGWYRGGLADEIRISDVARSESEISATWDLLSPIIAGFSPQLTGVAVAGSVTVVEGDSITLGVTASFDDGTKQDYTGQVSWTVTPPVATIDSNGVLTAGSVTADTDILVQASYGAVTGTLTVFISNVNQVPVADTGSLSVTQDTVAYGTLTGSDPDGGPSPLTFEIVVDGAKGTATISDANTGAYSYSPYGGQTGADAFSFRVYDGQDYSPAATVSVAISVVNAPPSPAILATSEAYEGDVVSYAVSFNDPDGPAPYSYTLDFGDGNSISGTTSFSAVAGSHVYLVDNSSGHLMSLTVTDALGAGGSDNHSIVIRNVAPYPTIVAPSTASVGQSVLFDVSVVDPADTVFVYNWDFENDGTYELFNSPIGNPVHVYAAASTYTVYLQVGDGTGWGTDTHTITVTGSNAPPAPSISAVSSAGEGEEVLFYGSFTDPDGTGPYSTYWEWGDGTATENALNPGHTYRDDGIFDVIFTVTDAGGAAGSTTWPVTVSNLAPVADAGPDQVGHVSESLLFDASASYDPGPDDNLTLSYAWDFADGNTASGVAVLHSYAATGTYVVSVTVSDGDGGAQADTLVVTIPDAVTWYVDINAPAATEDGLTWATAFSNPQDAVDAAWTGDQVLVAAGTYAPQSTADPTVPILAMKAGVDVIGGWEGAVLDAGETPGYAPTVNVTTFDGLNAMYRAVVGASNTILDGVTLTRAWNNSSATEFQYGAGYLADAVSDITLSRVTLKGNYISALGYGSGGGMAVRNSTGVLVEDCVFDSNRSRGAGGALYNSNSGMTVTGTTFYNNDAWGSGAGWLANAGGIYTNLIGTVSATVTNCVFDSNHAIGAGGALQHSGIGALSIDNCSFTRNISGSGGAVSASGVSLTISDSEFLRNSGTGWASGGAINYNSTGGNLSIARSRFVDNMGEPTIGPQTIAGAIFIGNHQTAYIENCLFARNQGGTVWVGIGLVDIVNSTFAGGLSYNEGGAVLAQNQGVASLTNCVLWGNYASTPVDGTRELSAPAGQLTVAYSDVKMVTAGDVYPGAGNIASDPAFADTVDYMLTAASPCANAGTSTGAPTDDLGGAARPDPVFGVVDMGAWEWLPPAISSLSVSGPSTVDDGTTGTFTAVALWADATTTDVTPHAAWAVTPGTYASVDAGLLATSPVVTDVGVTVSASLAAYGTTVADSVPVTITRTNTAPVAQDMSETVFEDVLKDILVTAADPDLDLPVYSLSTPPLLGSVILVDPDAGLFQYVPSADVFGTDQFVFAATDGGALSDTGVVTITILPVNDPPTFTPGGNVTVAEDSGAYAATWATGISVGPANESGQTPSFAVTSDNPSLFSVQPAVDPAGVLTFQPLSGTNGTATILVTIFDDGGTDNGGFNQGPTLPLTVTVTPVNDAPSVSINSAPASVDEGSPALFAGSFSDVDGTSPYTVLWSFGDGNSVGSTLSPSHTFADDGTYTVTLTVTDSGTPAEAGTDSAAVTVNNVAPVASASADTLLTTVDQNILFDGSGSSDAGSDVLTYSWDFGDGSPATAFTTSPTASYAYTFAGAFTATLTVQDGDGGSDTDTVGIVVMPSGLPVTWYVDVSSPAGSGGSGTSWDSAFDHPQKAMMAATAGDTVLVARGTYHSADTLAGTPIIGLVDGVTVQGGHCPDGDFTCTPGYDPVSYPTILDGDWTGDGVGETLVIVQGASNVTFGGFTITNGDLDYAMLNNGIGSMVVYDCVFFDNESSLDGAAIYNTGVLNFHAVNCVFDSNYAGGFGGVIYADGGTVALTSCEFTNNEAGQDGGAVFAGGPTALFVNGSRFTGNRAGLAGGAISAYAASSLDVYDTIFELNTAPNNTGLEAGGAVRSYQTPTTINRSLFRNNSARWYGGAVDIQNNPSSNSNIINSLFISNSSINYGGGISARGTGPAVRVQSSTFVENDAVLGEGGAVYQESTGLVNLVNSILWGAQSWTPVGNSEEVGGVAPVITWSDVQMTAGTYAGAGNIASDPAFAETALYTLSALSDCVDAGTDIGYPIDYGGHPRPYGPAYDMGAWERVNPPEGSLFTQADNRLTSWDAQDGFATYPSTVGAPFYPTGITAYNGKVYFRGYLSPDYDLWSYDKADGLTRLTTGNFSPHSMAVHDGVLYMSGRDSGGFNQMWTLDSGDTLSQITTVSGGLSGYFLTNFDGKLYFSTSTGLWSLDSTNGPAPVPTTGGPGSPQELTVYRDKLYFTGDDPATAATTTDYQLWSYDAANGFSMVSTVGGQWGLSPEFLSVLDGSLYFQALPVPAEGRKLYSYTDGTGIALETAYPIISTWGLYHTVYNGRIYLSLNQTSGVRQLYSYDRENGLQLAATAAAPSGMNPFEMAVYGDRLLFPGYQLGPFANNEIVLWSYSSTGGAATVAGSAGMNFSGEDILAFNPVTPPVADASGTWTFQETITADDCDGYVGSVYYSRVNIRQDGSMAVVNTDVDTENFSLVGNRVAGTMVYPDGTGTTTELYNLTISAGGNTITGTSTWNWSDGGPACFGQSSHLGLKD